MADQRQITVAGITLTVLIERKAVKNINARLRDTTLHISAPQSINDTALDRAIIELAHRLIRRVHKRQINNEEDALALVRQVAARFPNPPVIRHATFTLTKARWGSYSVATGTVRLNAALLRMPRWVLEAVAAHEIAHAIHPNHSPAFWRLLRSVCPDTDRAQAFLAAVAWMAHSWDDLLPVERALLAQMHDKIDDE
ncbi:MAG: M48 family metallopeptidase [Roseiflexus sp.]|jgi:predicted metal-dependent hydrolase|nr:M48 family metallopeptidase [Roseiflexus sp.]MBO9365376.1 M48 family metallopeptidase [Roseiflexus sp.]MBO9381590.1 M48 family metallopeptidase [Roseiflexus sp.]MBO9390301.1 M48 family metallopeptidase [Roseiflexus sp.]